MKAIVVLISILGSSLAFPENGGVDVGNRGWDSWAEDLTGLFTGLWGKYSSILSIK